MDTFQWKAEGTYLLQIFMDSIPSLDEYSLYMLYWDKIIAWVLTFESRSIESLYVLPMTVTCFLKSVTLYPPNRLDGRGVSWWSKCRGWSAPGHHDLCQPANSPWGSFLLLGTRGGLLWWCSGWEWRHRLIWICSSSREKRRCLDKPCGDLSVPEHWQSCSLQWS